MTAAGEQQFDYMGADGARIAAYRWAGSSPPRGAIVVAHGMGEHARRYRHGLAELIEDGFIVYAPDHRGHGATCASADGLGDFGPGGFQAVVDDLAILVREVRSKHPDLPVVLLGHSMGSFAAQLFILDHAELVDGVALSGSAALDRIAAAVVDPEVMGQLNAPFEPARTPFDWLSRDEAQVDSYIADPLCGFSLTPDSFASLLAGASRLADSEEISAIAPDLPIYVFSGLQDPLAGALGALEPLIDRYRAAKLDLTVDLYEGARHELLNETNRGEVARRLGKWVRSVVKHADRLDKSY